MPFDVYGNSVIPGELYAVGQGTKKTISETRHDLELDVLLIKPRGKNHPWLRSDEIEDADRMEWVPVNAQGEPLNRNGEPISQAGDVDEVDCVVDPRESVKSAILRARVLKDQIDAIETELVVELGAMDDRELRDAIMQAVHGDGSADSVLQLIEV